MDIRTKRGKETGKGPGFDIRHGQPPVEERKPAGVERTKQKGYQLMQASSGVAPYPPKGKE